MNTALNTHPLPSTRLAAESSCSHVLLWVRNLREAVTHFQAAGFEVTYASSHHAHIWFSHGPIIELLTTPRHAWLFKWPIDCLAGRGAGKRMLRWGKQGEGFCDLAMLCADADLHSQLQRLNAGGVAMGRPVNWRRTANDGRQIRFRFVYPRHDRLPFLVTPYSPSQHPPQTAHANGATGLAAIHLGVHPTDQNAIERLIGDDPLLHLQPAPHTGVQALEISGLTHSLNLHGAQLLSTVPAEGHHHA